MGKTRSVTVRFLDDDFSRISAAAEQAGVGSVSEFVRQSCLGARVASQEWLQSIRREVNKIGLNINQIAKTANTSGHDTAMYSLMNAQVAEMQKIIESLGR